MHATCATTDCTVPEECRGDAAPSCAAFLPQMAGRTFLATPICARCQRERWTAGVTFVATTGDPDAPCSNCNQALRHGLCTEEDGAFVAADGEICGPCTDDLRRAEADAAERARDDAINRRVDEARGK